MTDGRRPVVEVTSTRGPAEARHQSSPTPALKKQPLQDHSKKVDYMKERDQSVDREKANQGIRSTVASRAKITKNKSPPRLKSGHTAMTKNVYLGAARQYAKSALRTLSYTIEVLGSLKEEYQECSDILQPDAMGDADPIGMDEVNDNIAALEALLSGQLENLDDIEKKPRGFVKTCLVQ